MQAINAILAGEGHGRITKNPDGETVVSSAPSGPIVSWSKGPDASFDIRDADIPLVQKVCTLINRHADGGRLLSANVYMSRRVPEDAPAHHAHGWLEYVVVMHYNTGSRLTVGVIQRTIGADIECHS